MSEDFMATSATIVLESIVLGLLLRNKAWRRYPLLCVYFVWGLFSDLAAMGLSIARTDSYSALLYFRFYAANVLIDAVLQFALLIELMRSVLVSRQQHAAERFAWGATPVVSLLVALTGLICWVFAKEFAFGSFPAISLFMFRLQTTMGLLRIVCFVAMLFSRSSFSIGATATAMQVSVGLAFYSTVSLLVQLVQSHPLVADVSAHAYHFLDRLLAICYLATLAYWAACFWRRPAGLVTGDIGG